MYLILRAQLGVSDLFVLLNINKKWEGGEEYGGYSIYVKQPKSYREHTATMW